MMRVTLLFGLLAFTSSGHGAALVDRSSNTGQSSPLVIPSPLSMAAQEQAFSCNVAHSSRTDCGYLGTTKDDCERKGCCWSPTEMDGVPWCFHRDSTACAGYRLVSSSETAQSLTALLELKGGCRVYGPDVKRLKLQVTFETDTRLHVKLSDADNERFEVPEALFRRPEANSNVDKESAAYKFMLADGEQFAFKVVRKSDGEVIFDSSSPGGGSFIKPLIYEEQYLEISSRLPENANIFGLGEVVHSFRRDPANTRQTMWARDAPTPKDQNVYGSHPFHMEMRNGKAHGVFLLNANGMDVILRPGVLTYKVIGGILDFYFFIGPSPADVVHQYYEVIGRPFMIPYWVLGFHHCRYGYKNIWEVEEVVRRYKEAKIPLETMWTDIDYMDDKKDFTFDEKNFPVNEVKRFVKELHTANQKYVLILDPAIKVEKGYKPFEEAMREGIFMRNPDGSVYVGKVWPGLTAFPDFVNPKTQEWWTKWIREFVKEVPVDGLWIDMNEPASFCDGNCGRAETVIEEIGNRELGNQQMPLLVENSWQDRYNRTAEYDPRNPRYRINNFGGEVALHVKTAPVDALHHGGLLHYDLHNLYGHSEAIMTYNAVTAIHPDKRPFVLSRSTFASSGAFVGHWTGDNWSNWEHLYLSIPAMLNFQLFGIPLVGADICGFVESTTEELCARWMELGAFYPFSRNHNAIDNRPQEPYLWQTVAEASRRALAIRYQLLPYFYTLFYQAHKFGSTVARPFFFEFPGDQKTVSFDRQFLIGPALLITPVLEPGARHVDGYFPGASSWFDWYTNRMTANHSANGAADGKWVRLAAPLEHIPVHIRGGHILPLHKTAMTVAELRQKNFDLLVALDGNQRAQGTLYLDDGQSIKVPESRMSYMNFVVEPQVKSGSHRLTVSGLFNYKPAGAVDRVTVTGLVRRPMAVFLSGRPLPADQWSFDQHRYVLEMHHLEHALHANFVIEWRY